MTRLLLPGTILIWLLLTLPLTILGREIDASLSAEVDAAREQLYHFNLDSALILAQDIQNNFPEYPHGYFYEAYLTAIYFSQDKTNDSLDARLHETVKRSVEVSEQYRKGKADEADALYHLGVSYGVLGIYYVLNRSYLKGYIYGRRGKNYLEKVIEVDSTYGDAYLGLGIFHYYVDLLPGVVKFFAGLLGLHGDRQLGLEEVNRTARQGRFFSVEADFAQACIRFFLEGDRFGAIRTIQQLHRRYPQNPAFTLMIGYHLRRQGRVREALHFFGMVEDKYQLKLPQISVMKYYNMGVCYFRLNDFDRADQVFENLIRNPLRKTPYYQAALPYYRGLLADLHFNRNLAENYFKKISKNKHTQYWYYISRLHVNFAMDSLLQKYILASNDIFTANFSSAEKTVDQLTAWAETRYPAPSVPYFYYLVQDLRGKLAFRRGHVKESADIYSRFINNVNAVKDDFVRAWIYIQYARVLREMKEWDAALNMLDRARDCKDEYTRLIIGREKFIIEKYRKN